MGQLDTSRVRNCELCTQDGGLLIVRGLKLRVIRVLDADYPGFYRVIWNDHVSEFSALSQADRALLMDTVATVESEVRKHLSPAKVNLASLGNVVPHLHWHVIARYADDKHFPQPIWGTVQRPQAKPPADVMSALPDLDHAMAFALAHLRM